MDYSKIGIFSMMKTKMRYMSERQGLISKNIANADTPGFQPQDLKPADFKTLAAGEMKKVSLAVTQAGHIAQSRSSAGFNSQKRLTFETTPVGNAVVLEEEAMKMADNSADHQTTTTAYKRIVEMFRLAVQRQ